LDAVPPRVAAELTVVRQVFPTWSVRIPLGLSESFDTEGAYWNAADSRRSVSLTSIVLTDRRGRVVPARKVLRACPPMAGKRVGPPPDLAGWGVIIEDVESPIGSKAISGIIVADGRVLIATVTSDDLDWAASVWDSIRYDDPDSPLPDRRTADERLRPST
jgi:hypothetical protein